MMYLVDWWIVKVKHQLDGLKSLEWCCRQMKGVAITNHEHNKQQDKKQKDKEIWYDCTYHGTKPQRHKKKMALLLVFN
jgi:hypothetical protein